MANKTLDIINLIAAAATEEEKEKAIAKILSDAFERSCILFDGYKIAVSYGGEDISFFDEENEVAVAEWCKTNRKSGGRGTDTLREAQGIYFPLGAKSETVVIGFSCKKSKMTVTDRMIFS